MSSLLVSYTTRIFCASPAASSQDECAAAAQAALAATSRSAGNAAVPSRVLRLADYLLQQMCMTTV